MNYTNIKNKFVDNQRFAAVDAMVIRTQFGSLLDRASKEKERFVISRRGDVKALLVPIEDLRFIEEGLQNEVYEVISQANGAISDPALQDASSTIDTWVYGDAGQEQHEK